MCLSSVLKRTKRVLGLAVFSMVLFLQCSAPSGPAVQRFAVLPVGPHQPNNMIAAVRLLESHLAPGFEAPRVLLPLHTLQDGLKPQDLLDEPAAVRAARRLGLHGYLLLSAAQDQSMRLHLGGEFEDVVLHHSLFPSNDFCSAVDSLMDGALFRQHAKGRAPAPAIPPAVMAHWGDALQMSRQGRGEGPLTKLRETVAIASQWDVVTRDMARLLLEAGLTWRESGRDPQPLWLEAGALLKQAPSPRLLGRLYLYQGRLNWAEKAFKSAYNASHQDVELKFDISRLHPSRWPDLGAHRPEPLLRDCLHLNPVYLPAALALGEWLFRQNRAARVEALYHDFLNRSPGQLDILMALGRMYVLSNQPVKIIETYQQLIEIEPNFAPAYYNLGVAYYNSERFKQAAGFFDRCLELKGTPDSHFYLATMAEARGDTLAAISNYRQRLEARKKGQDTFAEQARRRLRLLLSETGQI